MAFISDFWLGSEYVTENALRHVKNTNTHISSIQQIHSPKPHWLHWLWECFYDRF